jgi:hypothetical protein
MLVKQRASETIADWPADSREAAKLVIDAHGEPDEVSPSRLTWFEVQPWKRIEAQRTAWKHDFPAPHIDAVESFLDYRVPVEKVTPLARFDGSVVVERTAGEVSARCHDEQANLLALNLMDDIVEGRRDPDDARAYYAKEFLDYRRKRPTPYMQRLRFQPGDATAADPDQRVLSDEDLKRAQKEGGGQSG